MRCTSLTSRATPSSASSSRATAYDGSRAVCRATRLASAGLAPSLKPRAASSGYRPAPSRPRPWPLRSLGPQYRVVIHKTRPPSSRTSSGRASGARKGRAAWSVTFFAGFLQGGGSADLAEQAGDNLVGQLLEGVMHVAFDLAEARRVVAQGVQPGGLFRLQLRRDRREGVRDGADRRPVFGLQAHLHGVAPGEQARRGLSSRRTPPAYRRTLRLA